MQSLPSSSPARRRIVVADDHPVFLEALATTFARVDDIEVVAALTSRDAVAATLRDGDVDLALIDLRMPGMAGAGRIAALCAGFPATRIAIISGSTAVWDIREALQAGAVGYVPKTLGPGVIVAAVRLMLAGAVYVPPEILGARDDRRDGVTTMLTPRERQILPLIALGLANKEIACRIGIAEVTVKLHVRALLAKLKAKNRAGVVAAGLALGVMDPGSG